MIESKELRRLNLVEFEGRIFEIECISEEAPFLRTIEFGYGVVTYQNINPVPTTEDILLKLGFEKYEFDHKPTQYRYKTRLIVIRDGNFYDYGTDVKLEFVHRLQNLYFETLNEELPTDKILNV